MNRVSPERPPPGAARTPSVRRRFVHRARTLKEHRGFLSDVDQAIAQWKSDYPAYAIGSRPVAPDEWWITPGQWFVWPPRLLTRLRTENAFFAENRTSSATLQWSQLVLKLCTTWWPAKYYNNWLQAAPYQHPAGPFVSGCLIYRPPGVPEDWILAQGLFPSELSHDPGDTLRHPEAVFYRTAYFAVLEAVYESVSRGVSLTPEMLNTIDCEAHARGHAASYEVMLPRDNQFHYLHLHAGMTREDYRAAEPYVFFNVLDHGAPEWTAHIAGLRQEGMSDRAIARLLGVDHRQVSRHG